METFRPYTPLSTLVGHAHKVNYMAFSPCGRYLLTRGEEGLVFFWDYMKGLNLHTLVLNSPVLCLCWGSSSSFFVGCLSGALYFVGCLSGALYFFENVTVGSSLFELSHSDYDCCRAAHSVFEAKSSLAWMPPFSLWIMIRRQISLPSVLDLRFK